MKLIPKLSSFRKNVKINNKINFFLTFIIPVSLLVAAMFINIFINFISHKQLIKNNTNDMLTLFSLHCEDKISSLLNSTTFFENNSAVTQLLNNTNKISHGNTNLLQSSLEIYKTSNPIIDNVAFLYPKNNIVVSPQGSYSYEDFFSTEYIIDTYADTYFKSFRFYNNASYRIFSPSKVKTAHGEKIIIPIIIREIGNQNNNYLFISVSFSRLLQNDISDHSFSKNSEIFMLNNYSGMSYKSTGNTGTNIADTDIYHSLLRGKSSFVTHIYGKKQLVLSYSPRNTILGYTYYTMIPYNDIYFYQRHSILITLFLSIVIILYAFFLTYKNTNELFSSLLNIRKILGNDKLDGSSLLSNITESANNIINEYTSLCSILPYAQEQYIINYLNNNNNNTYMDVNASEFLTKNLPFKYNLYKSVIVQIFPTKQFSSAFPPSLYSQLLHEVTDIIKLFWTNDMDTFFISSEDNTLYILINSDNTNIDSVCDDICKKIEELLKNDSNLIDLIIGKGSIGTGMQGLKKSHDEAINNLIHVFPQKSFLKIPQRHTFNHLTYDIESKLFIALMESNSSKALRIINEFIDSISPSNEYELRQVYSQMLETIFRAMRNKKIILPNQLNELDIKIRVNSEATENTYKTIVMLINTFTEQTKNQGIASSEIIDYIKNNYTDNTLSLDKISEITGADVKYCSAIIKNSLGMGFHDYLSNLRIEHAKELLRTTNMSQQDILEASGFTNRQTFSRVFKKITGVTSNEYRKNNS